MGDTPDFSHSIGHRQVMGGHYQGRIAMGKMGEKGVKESRGGRCIKLAGRFIRQN